MKLACGTSLQSWEKVRRDLEIRMWLGETGRERLEKEKISRIEEQRVDDIVIELTQKVL